MTVNLTNVKSGIINRLATEKKKVIVAAGLIALMIFMWAKLFVGQKPRSASAALSPRATSASNDTSSKDSSVTFVDLPFETGRHDVLARDFFNIENAVFSSNKQVNIVSADGGQEQVQVIADKLRLDAISMAAQPEAFINDRLVKVGDILVVTDGLKSYECEIVKIDCLKVLVKCGKAEIELKLKQPDEF